jgi:hypothetical protein
LIVGGEFTMSQVGPVLLVWLFHRLGQGGNKI